MLEYREHPAPRPLRPWVACLWRMRGIAPAALSHRVLPDGCADLLLDLNATRDEGAGATLVGPMSTAIVVCLSGAIDIIGIRLLPQACGSVSGVPASALRDVQLGLGEVGCAFDLSPAALAEPACADPVTRVWEALSVALRDRTHPDALVAMAAQRLRRAADGDALRVAALADDLGVSERALERRFNAALGMSPAAYRRLQRFHLVLRRHARGERNWADLAAGLGYSDQAHLSREFKSWAGMTPSAWALEQAPRVGFVQDAPVTAL